MAKVTPKAERIFQDICILTTRDSQDEGYVRRPAYFGGALDELNELGLIDLSMPRKVRLTDAGREYAQQQGWIAAPAVEPQEQPKKETTMAETFTYGLFNRPAMYGTVPAGFTNAQDNKEFAYGTIDYDHRLTDEEIYRYELARFSPNTFDLPIGATVERLDAGEDGYTIIRYYRGRYILTHKATGDEEYSVKVSDVRAIAAPAAAPEAKEAASEPTSAPETVDGSMRPCEHCNGSGHVTRSGLYIVPCPECDGTGIHTEPTLLTPDDIIALAIDDIRDQRRPANPARFADNVQSAIDSIRAENKALKQRLAAAQKALVAIVSIKYDDMQAIRDRAETGLIESDYYVASLK